jgi:brefeldin A-inhibited guanine nucleotide-exchange protein
MKIWYWILELTLYTGFMKQLPNLLKQETSSGGCYVSVLMRMYANLENISDRDDKRDEIENKLIP